MFEITETRQIKNGFYRLKWIGCLENYQKESSFIKTAVAFSNHKKDISKQLNKVYTWRYKWRYRFDFYTNSRKFYTSRGATASKFKFRPNKIRFKRFFCEES